MSMLRRVALALTLVAAACTQSVPTETVAGIDAAPMSSTLSSARTTSTSAAVDDVRGEFDESQPDAGYR